MIRKVIGDEVKEVKETRSYGDFGLIVRALGFVLRKFGAKKNLSREET